jgi:hypothetical protein
MTEKTTHLLENSLDKSGSFGDNQKAAEHVVNYWDFPKNLRDKTKLNPNLLPDIPGLLRAGIGAENAKEFFAIPTIYRENIIKGMRSEIVATLKRRGYHLQVSPNEEQEQIEYTDTIVPFHIPNPQKDHIEFLNLAELKALRTNLAAWVNPDIEEAKHVVIVSQPVQESPNDPAVLRVALDMQDITSIMKTAKQINSDKYKTPDGIHPEALEAAIQQKAAQYETIFAKIQTLVALGGYKPDFDPEKN